MFVGQKRCPVELFEAIISFLDEPRDLLSFGLTCRLIYYIIVPDHLEFRQLRCSPQRTYIWQALLERPRLAKNIYSLELADEELLPHYNGLLVPTTLEPFNKFSINSPFSSESLPSFATILAKAIMKMSRLKRFIWDKRHPFDTELLLSSIVPSLSYIPSIEEISLDYSDLNQPLELIPAVSFPVR